MADLTPDERATLEAALTKASYISQCFSDYDVTIWRAARAYENEACAKVCDAMPLYSDGWTNGPATCAAAIRERAKGLT